MSQLINPFQEARQELHTVRDWVRFAVSQFTRANLAFGHGNTNAFDEAVYLVLHTLNLPLEQLNPFLEAHLTATERHDLADILRRRVEDRVPAAYLTHEAWLGDYRFYVDERVIVPRSFIAELLQEQLNPWVSPEHIHSALDLCTGSGCLAILLADAFEQAEVDAVDLSPEALAVAERNLQTYDLAGRINLIRSDLFNNLSGKRYDLIVSNPPYVDGEAMNSLPSEYKHEPELALASGDDGLDATREILRCAREHLTDNGVLIVEIGHNRDALEAAYPDVPFTWLDTAAGNEYVFLLHRAELPA